MKLALLGYGKMGKMVERLCFPHTIVEPMHADVLIDFSHPEAVKKHVQMAAAMHQNIVIGTTGWYGDLEMIKSIAEVGEIGIIYGPNFSIGVHIMTELVQHANRLMSHFPEYDVIGIESHHKAKVDAPSGTALKLGVPFVSVRVGYDPGTHKVIYDSEVDTIEISHKARSREGFARGAIRAAEWIHGKKGFFSFESCLEDLWKE
ncbi:MAG: dihydrodipicolinate reductase [Simkaniaceae bacterium]|nr:dihydrodipicolinate reductase [Simkaniaceae bacterium]